ncbi:hypothetical protein O8B93_18550 [Agrobacterium rhizogenes]|uniref:hypothetical protein n=1 Tax=Rhizobium rhizogenes TaxID=359 RepID=UPI0022B7382B|nr:hypothetical protein [Rhizobium rhizogenes]MCZ7449590.1 hypothetical protein [Rhizobium rhizogenes]
MPVKTSVTLSELYARQLDDHRRNPGFQELGLDVPVAAILANRQDRWDYNEFLRIARDRMGASVHEYSAGGQVNAVVLAYGTRPPQLWVSADCGGYAELYERFCIEKLNLRPSGNYRGAGFDLDHAYCKAAVPKEVKAYIRLFLVPSQANRSWGGYFERKLKDRISQEVRVGLRNETVAIMAKVAGIATPRLGRRVRGRPERIRNVVDRLIETGMLDPSTREPDFHSLSAFCDVISGKAENIMSKMTRLQGGRYHLETWTSLETTSEG